MFFDMSDITASKEKAFACTDVDSLQALCVCECVANRLIIPIGHNSNNTATAQTHT